MFLSYEETNFIAYDPTTQIYQWEYRIVDSEFEEIGVATGKEDDGGANGDIELGIAVIDTYKKRNLPVTTNLIRAFLWFKDKHGWSTVDKHIEWNKRHNPKFSQYEAEINKYLALA